MRNKYYVTIAERSYLYTYRNKHSGEVKTSETALTESGWAEIGRALQTERLTRYALSKEQVQQGEVVSQRDTDFRPTAAT